MINRYFQTIFNNHRHRQTKNSYKKRQPFCKNEIEWQKGEFNWLGIVNLILLPLNLNELSACGLSPNVKSELLKGTAVAVQMHNDVAWREKGRERRKIVSRIFHTL